MGYFSVKPIVSNCWENRVCAATRSIRSRFFFLPTICSPLITKSRHFLIGHPQLKFHEDLLDEFDRSHVKHIATGPVPSLVLAALPGEAELSTRTSRIYFFAAASDLDFERGTGFSSRGISGLRPKRYMITNNSKMAAGIENSGGQSIATGT